MKYLLLAAALIGIFGAEQKTANQTDSVDYTNDGPPIPPPPK
jgi:hypothetical protein